MKWKRKSRDESDESEDTEQGEMDDDIKGPFTKDVRRKGGGFFEN